MTKRVCIDCPTLIEQGTRSGRCAPCERARDKARGTRQQRGYDSAHDQLRAWWQRKLDAGETVYCWRCLTKGTHTRIDPNHWHLGHDDHDRTQHRGPECPPCNTATSGRRHTPTGGPSTGPP